MMEWIVFWLFICFVCSWVVMVLCLLVLCAEIWLKTWIPVFLCMLRTWRVQKRCLYRRQDKNTKITVFVENGIVVQHSELLGNIIEEAHQMFPLFLKIVYPEFVLCPRKKNNVGIYFLSEKTYDRISAFLGVRTDGFYLFRGRALYVRGREAQCDMTKEGDIILKHELFHHLCRYYRIDKNFLKGWEEGAALVFEMSHLRSNDNTLAFIYEDIFVCDG